MAAFVEIGQTLIDMSRLLVVQHNPEKREGVFYTREHYKAIFDTGRELRLTTEEGQELQQMLGSMATTSEIAT